MPGQIRQRLLEHRHVARQQRPQDQTGGELPALSQMADQRQHIILRRRGERDRRLLAGFLGDAMRAILIQPVAADDKFSERLRQLDNQSLTDRRRKIAPRQQYLADRRQMAEAIDDAVDREWRDVGTRDFPEARGKLRPYRFRRWRRPRSAADSARRAIAVWATRTVRRHGIDEFGVEQEAASVRE